MAEGGVLRLATSFRLHPVARLTTICFTRVHRSQGIAFLNAAWAPALLQVPFLRLKHGWTLLGSQSISMSEQFVNLSLWIWARMLLWYTFRYFLLAILAHRAILSLRHCVPLPFEWRIGLPAVVWCNWAEVWSVAFR